jgi:hypothetical protein
MLDSKSKPRIKITNNLRRAVIVMIDEEDDGDDVHQTCVGLKKRKGRTV